MPDRLQGFTGQTAVLDRSDQWPSLVGFAATFGHQQSPTCVSLGSWETFFCFCVGSDLFYVCGRYTNILMHHFSSLSISLLLQMMKCIVMALLLMFNEFVKILELLTCFAGLRTMSDEESIASWSEWNSSDKEIPMRLS